MRIVIDLQGAQSGSRHRGIGRYSLALAQAMVRNRGSHEVIIVLNGLFPETIEPLRAAFDGILSQDDIRVWFAPGPVQAFDVANNWRRHTAELIREEFLASLRPDIVHVTSLFEGFGDDAVHSIGLFSDVLPTAVTFYDLIPLIQSDVYLDPNPFFSVLYKEKLEHLKRADLFLAISESSRQEALNYLNISPGRVVNISAAADDHFMPANLSEVEEKSLRLKFGLTRHFLMYSGATDERKNHLRLIKAFSMLPFEIREKYQLSIVGGLPQEHREKFEAYTKLCGLKSGEVVITGRVSDKELVGLCSLCDLFIFPSWHEGFGLPALEAMSCGAPVIGSNTTSLPEVIGRKDALFDPFDEKAICKKIVEMLSNDSLRNDLAQHGLEQAKKFSWEESARRVICAFEEFHANRVLKNYSVFRNKSDIFALKLLIDSIAKNDDSPVSENDWTQTAKAIAMNGPRPVERQLLVDVSELVQRDGRTGIQRVVRSVLSELLAYPPRGFRVEPVYATQYGLGYRYARNFKLKFLNCETQEGGDDLVEAFSGDIFFGLDMQHHVVINNADYYKSLRNIGVPVYFLVHDLLPIFMPGFFDPDMSSIHSKWLSVLAETDGVVCVSRTVADEYAEWLDVFGPKRLRPFKIGWSHNGADLARSVPTKGLPSVAADVLNNLSKCPTFLMVGTLEPRKAQMQTLLAFELLWSHGININLVIVGKRGWDVDLLVEILRSHPERNRRMFWLDGISDEYLEEIYSASTCLIAASEGEGFGLPLIEAAQHGLPIIARDIPVFREVAGEHAFYFSGLTPDVLADGVREWLHLNERGKAPQSTSMPWLTWEQSTKNLMDVILTGQWYRKWMSDDVLRFWGSDNRFGTQVGKRVRCNIVTTSQEGYLLYGPYIELSAGKYKLIIRGRKGDAGAAKVDVVLNEGALVICECFLDEKQLEGEVASMEFFLDSRCAKLEIRVHVSADADLEVSMVEIIPSSR